MIRGNLTRMPAAVTAGALVASGMVLTADARRAAPAPPGTIAFLSDRAANRGGEIYTVGAIRGSRRSLSRAPLTADYGVTPSSNGLKVAFVSNRDGTWAVWAMGSRGSRPARVGRINGQPFEQTISWDPTGKRLAFDSGIFEGVRFEVWIASLNGGRPRRLGRGASPDWSPKGDRIAFEQWLGDEDDPRVRIAVVSPRRHVLWTRAGFMPQWSPDGRRLAFLTERGVVVLAAPSGKTLRRLGRSIEWFAWLPDGRHLIVSGPRTWIVTASGQVVWTAPLDSEGLWSRDGRRIAYTTRKGLFVRPLRGRPRRIAPSLGTLMDWSVDGKHIAVVGGRGRRLIAVRTDGGGVRTVASEPVGSLIERAFWQGNSRLLYESHAAPRGDIYLRTGGSADRRLTSSSTRYASPDWAPDGTRLAASATDVACTRDCPSEIAVIDASSARAIWVTTRPSSEDRPFAEAPRWSPDGRFIAFTRTGPPGNSVRVIPAEGGSEREVASDAHSPAWSPDGRRVAYLGDGLFVANADGTGARRLASTGEAQDGSTTWSPDGERIAWREGATIRVVSADGATEPSVAVRLGQLACASRMVGNPAGLAWSRDGTRFVFGGCARAGSALANLDLWSVRTDGSGATRLTRTPASEWAPALR